MSQYMIFIFVFLTSFGITVSRFIHLTTTDSMFFIFLCPSSNEKNMTYFYCLIYILIGGKLLCNVLVFAIQQANQS